MTQMMLFDAQSYSEVALPTVREESTTSYASPSVREGTSVGSRAIPVYDPQRGEIQRLGDLAHLIIARYELVAQRRREIQARRAASLNAR